MTKSHNAKLIARIDATLEDGALDAEATEALCEVLRPDPRAERWPDLEVVLHAAEHPAVAPKLRAGELPEALAEALGQALQAVLPLLGVRGLGDPAHLAHTARRRLDAEARKYELVVERLSGELEPEQAMALVRRYLETRPSPLFATRLRRAYPGHMAAAEAAIADQPELEAMAERDALVDLLVRPPVGADAAAEALADELAALAAAVDVRDALLLKAIETGSADQKIAAAALAVWTGSTDVAPTLIGAAVGARGPAGATHVGAMAVLAARLAPAVSRQVFGQLLAEASWQNPEEPEAELTPARAEAILAARCLLPRLGSPLGAVDPEAMPETLPEASLRDLPARIARLWAILDALGL